MQGLPKLVDGGEVAQNEAAEEEFDLSDVLGEDVDLESAGDRAAAAEAELQVRQLMPMCVQV